MMKNKTMYTAKIKSKDLVEGQLNIIVEFTDGSTIVAEKVIPQNESAFYSWVNSRLETFNGGVTLDTDLVVDATVEKTVVVDTPLTPEQIATNEWFDDYRKMQEVGKLIDLGIFTGDEAQIVALRTKLQTTFKVEYIDLM